ncbi:hypothetical protein QR680_003252 [Steinernema hermaphroditum]|uniref:F-box domain-containing protein n=1 Tax=Steinernema hermaphroditum TaxID=289476 RepID=A0AA39LJR0_9BILA|nr:hypothetical protein QR680_003252 [Steinernema hermaphroditum]
MILLLVLLSVFVTTAEAENLKYVQAIWRHGDRAPSKLPYPKDIYDEANWPRGWGQLTNVGMEEMRELGHFLRHTYCSEKKKFIHKDYDSTEVYILSTDADRALTSAQSLLSGMFPPEKPFIWNKSVKWQPIPVHAFEAGQPNPLLRPTAYKCPAYDKLLKEINTPLKEELLRNHTKFIEFVQENTGIPDSKSIVAEIVKLVDLNREMKHNLSQPDWVHKRWPEYSHNTTVEIITEMKRRDRMSEFEDSKLAVFRGGFLLGDFLTRAKNAVDSNNKNMHNMMLYSSHDGTVSALLSAMNVSDRQLVPYASCVIMEVVEDKKEHFVKLHYRKNKELIPLTVPGCEHKCAFAKFYDLLRPRAIFEEKQLKEVRSAMDSVPPIFLNEVFARLDTLTILEVSHLNTGRWASTAMNFRRQRRSYTAIVRPIAGNLDEFEYTLENHNTPDTDAMNPTLDEVLTAGNLRFCLLETFRISEYPFEYSRRGFHVTWHRIGFNHFFDDIFTRISLAPLAFEHSYQSGDGLFTTKAFLVLSSNIQKKNMRLMDLTLKGDWPRTVLTTIQEFMQELPNVALNVVDITYQFDARILHFLRKVVMENDHIESLYRIPFYNTGAQPLDKIEFVKKINDYADTFDMDCGDGKTLRIHYANDLDMYICVDF